MALNIWYKTTQIERGNPLPPLHRPLFLISSKGFFYIGHLVDRIVHTMAFVAPVFSKHDPKKCDTLRVTRFHHLLYPHKLPELFKSSLALAENSLAHFFKLC